MDPHGDHASHLLTRVKDKCMAQTALTQTNVSIGKVSSNILEVLHRAPVVCGSVVENKLRKWKKSLSSCKMLETMNL